MKTVLKVFATLTALLLIILIAGAVYLSSHLDQFKQLAINQVEEATGRKLVIGEAEMALSIKPTIKIKDVSLENAKWGTRPQMVKASSLIVRINLLSLLLGEIHFDEIRLIAPDVYLETNVQGQGNWVFSVKSSGKEVSPEQESNKSVPLMALERLEIEKGQFFYRDGHSTRKTNVSIDHLTLQPLSSGNTLALELAAKYLEHPITVEGKIGSLNTYLGNAPFPLDLNFETPDIQAKVNGAMTRPMDFQGLLFGLKLKAKTLSSLSWVAGTTLPPSGPLAVNGSLSVEDNVYRLKDLSTTLGNSDLSGTIELHVTKDKPKIIASLTASNINRSDFISQASSDMDQKSDEQPQPEVKQGKTSQIFSDNLLPFDSLKETDADISLKAKNILLDSVTLQNFDMKLLIENGVLTAKPIHTDIANGTIEANLGINASQQIAKVAADIHANQLDLGELLKTMTGKEHLNGGKTDFSLDLNAQGNSARALASTLNGQLLSSIGKAQINYDLRLAGGNLIIELIKKMNPLAEQQKTNELHCAVMRFNIKDGIATTDKGLAYESKTLKALGDGTIDLKTEKVNILLSSKSTIASLLQIKGPLEKPEIGVNPVGVLKKGTSLGAAILTGGLSYAAETLFDQFTSEGSPCEIAQRGISEKK
jgi:uncharacterized protein involved in outer membrane biogenesis